MKDNFDDGRSPERRYFQAPILEPRDPNSFCTCGSAHVLGENVFGKPQNRCGECGRIWKHIKKAEDPNYGGLGDWNTGPNDPFYKDGVYQAHDEGFDRAKEGTQGRKDSVYTNGKLVVDAIKSTGESIAVAAYKVVALPFVIVIGAIGGVFRWSYIVKKPKGEK